ncbi:phosphoribosyl-AMP cyclohydrolase [Alkalilimnicola ehrlichii]|uniref:Phosphoribosyl-AMP cyclohydrolase n=1 Tax=Alkalilimnicola ehrlichii TaxID=351052 RepID=A0A3E0WJU9_9GAMM|nr:phosphoribosyl-AMP cyclohydrolase [Alkalilimnicola ehrlichii]RFA26275.1 phosphoribosyl-AMP cyclohydrolase [Alkalilimnicola ehrlichii]RFA33260.1 phosphoribosyl-AMP cyclohydrolase [Alkalilimnicola ehrlichii]
MKSKLSFACAIALSLAGSAAFANTNVVNNNVTEAEVKAAQNAWGKALIQISSDYSKGGIDKARETAEAVLDAAYGYSFGPVLFKPTLASGEQTFRTSREGALAYFVGHNGDFPSDEGFALKGWTDFSVNNAAVYINGNLALTMGHVILTDESGQTTTVDKTWGFKKDEQGDLRIVLHHSSLPFAPDA